MYRNEHPDDPGLRPLDPNRRIGDFEIPVQDARALADPLRSTPGL